MQEDAVRPGLLCNRLLPVERGFLFIRIELSQSSAEQIEDRYLTPRDAHHLVHQIQAPIVDLLLPLLPPERKLEEPDELFEPFHLLIQGLNVFLRELPRLKRGS